MVSRRFPLAGGRVGVGSLHDLDLSQAVRRLAQRDQHAVRIAGVSDGVTTLTQFGFDGTRLHASSSRSRIVDVAKLDEIENELQKTFAELEQQVAAADAQDEEQLGDASLHRVEKKLAKTENRPRPALIKVVDRRADDRSPLYERLLARGKSKMPSSLGAAMRKLVHLCFGVLKT